MNKKDKRIEVPLNWHEIDNIIVGLRILLEHNLIDKDYANELVLHLEPYSIKAKGEK